MMHGLSRKQTLSFAALIILIGIMMLFALLAQWAAFAIAGTVLAGFIGALSLVILRNVRTLGRSSSKAGKYFRRMEKDMAQSGRRQQELRALTIEGTQDLKSTIAATQENIRRLDATSAGLLDRLGAAERRLVGVLESLRLEIGHLTVMSRKATGSESRETEVETSLAELRKEVEDISTSTQAALAALRERVLQQTIRSSTSVVTKLTAVARDETRQVEALLQLLPQVQTRAPLPPSGRWAMDARALLHLSHICKLRKPRNILELGGGTSTVWLAYLLEGTDGVITSVDHDDHFAELTSEALRRHGLESNVRVRTASLRSISVHGESHEWYSNTAFEDLQDIDLLIVDGPPSSSGNLARYPALPALRKRLAPNCVIVVDDSERPDEAETIDRWLAEVPGYVRVDVGASRLAVLSPESISWNGESDSAVAPGLG